MDLQTTLPVPIVPRNGDDALRLELSEVHLAESRMEEVAFVTPQKAPELLALFTHSYLLCNEMIAKLSYEETRAEKELSRIRSILLIDRVPGLIKEKGLTNSADIRNALVEADPEYQAAQDKVDFIHATIELMKGKMKSMEMSFSSVKKIIDGENYNMLRKGGQKRLNGMLDEEAPVGGTEAKHPMFGKAR